MQIAQNVLNLFKFHKLSGENKNGCVFFQNDHQKYTALRLTRLKLDNLYKNNYVAHVELKYSENKH